LFDPGLQQGARPGGGRQIRIEFPPMDANKIGDRALQFVAARAALPACVKMGSNPPLIVRGELSFNIEEQLLIGGM
jgi:hypothetical protein